MIVTCPECSARYKLDRSRVSSRGARITCPRCTHVFVVYPSETQPDQATLPPAGAQNTKKPSPIGGRPVASARPKSSAAVARQPIPAPAPVRTPAPAPKRDASALDFRKVGIASWKVRVKIGLVYDFSDIRTLRKYISDGRVTPEDVISHDGSTWVPIGDIPDLDAYFVEVYERAEAAMIAAPTAAPATVGKMPEPGSWDEDEPTTILKVGGMGENLAAQALAAAAAEAAQAEAAVQSPPSRGQSAPGPGARPFVDPFAKLKEEKRRAPKAAPKGAVEPKRSLGPYVAIFAVLTLLGVGAWWYSNQLEPEIQSPPEVGNQAELDAAQRKVEEDLKALDAQLKADLDKARLEDEQRVDPDVLTPVGPGLRPVVPDRLPQGIQDVAVDYAGQCRSLTSQRNWPKAAQACSQAVKSNGRDLPSKVSYGIALYETGRADSAQGQLQQAQSMGSRDARVHKYLGHIAREQGDVFGANAHYQKYIATSPRDAAKIQALMQGG